MLMVLNGVLVAAMAGVVLVIGLGLRSMARGTPHRSQKLMQWRVGLQFVAIVLAVLIVLLNAR